jgi:hypothetical protein
MGSPKVGRATTVVTAAEADPLVRQAGRMLAEELARLTGVRVRQARRVLAKDELTVVVGVRDEVGRLMPGLRLADAVPCMGRLAPEGYVVQAAGQSTVAVAGNDALGALFGVGWLLSECRVRQRSVEWPGKLPVSTAPQTAIRGVQLGYRAINNTLDAWDLDQFEQYLRDLILFGCNTVELTPPVEGPGQRSSREWEMNLRLAALVHSYGLQVSLWAPVTDGDARDPRARRRVLDRRRELFASMAHIDDVFVPGGDPGETLVEVLMPLLADMAGILREAHPVAGLWVSHQGFEPPERDRFYEFLAREQPAWLRGVVYGPWTRDTIEHTRQALPAHYQLRAYPDITHSCRCQYPVPAWDPAYALIEGREVCNPRPMACRAVFAQVRAHCDGFVLYSDGNHDDVNKTLWLALGWDPEADPEECLRRYGRAYVGPEAEDEVARGLMGLERNWVGAVRGSALVPTTLSRWRRLYAAHRGNWRVQLHQFRALCDRHVQLKARHDEAREERAKAVLQQAVDGRVSPDRAVDRACRLLNEAPSAELRCMREELWRLGRELRQSIGLQMSVHLGGLDERGNVLDHLDEPLNNARWICAQLAAAKGSDEAGKLAAIARVLTWEDPGPGGFYDDLGNAERQPHLVMPVSAGDDPDCLRRPYEEFSFREYAEHGRLSWRRQASALYETPLQLRYTGLDPDARYTLRVVYAGRFRATMTLTANGRTPIHGPLRAPDPPEVLEFPIPRRVTRGGALTLEWRRVGCEGRGPQVAEVWLVKTAGKVKR